ncbi:MAG: methyltransferase domain-containing protein [Acidimicrobiales bacterium]
MEPKLQRRVQRYGWDRAAASYEPFWRDQLRPAHDELVRKAALKSGERVVDVACGSGQITFRAAEAVGAEGTVLGLDISAKMVAGADADRAERGTENVTFRRADAEQLGCDDAAYDVALCSLGLMYVPLPAVAVEEMHRCLVPAGRIAVSVWGERRNCGWAEIFPIVDHRVQSDVCPMFFSLGAPGAIESVLTGAGFRDVEVTRLVVELAYRNEEDAIGAAFLGGPVALPYGRFDDDTKRAVEEEYLASLAPFRDGNGYRVSGEFVVASASRGVSAA